MGLVAAKAVRAAYPPNHSYQAFLKQNPSPEDIMDKIFLRGDTETQDELIIHLERTMLGRIPPEVIHIIFQYRPPRVGELKADYQDKSLNLYAEIPTTGFEYDLSAPWTTTFDPHGHLVVVEHFTARIRTFNHQGQSIHSFDLPKSCSPVGLAFQSNGNFIISEHATSFVKIYRPGQEATPKTISADFHQPYSVAVDMKDNIYVADSGNLKVRVFNPEGEFLWELTHELFSSPTGIAISPLTGEIVVTDTQKDLIVIFDSQGTFLRSISVAGDDGLRYCPYSCTVDSVGHLIVPCRSVQRIQVYSLKTNELIRTFDVDFEPIHASVDCEGTLYLSDYMKHKLWVWK